MSNSICNLSKCAIIDFREIHREHVGPSVFYFETHVQNESGRGRRQAARGPVARGGHRTMTRPAEAVRSWLRRAGAMGRWIAEGERLPPPPDIRASARLPWVREVLATDPWPAESSRPGRPSKIGWMAWLMATEELPEAVAPSRDAGERPDALRRRGLLRWLAAPDELPSAPRGTDRGTDDAGLLVWLVKPERLPGSGVASIEEGRKGGD